MTNLLLKFIFLLLLEYYSGFNNAVSVFGGIVEKVNGITLFKLFFLLDINCYIF